jgi:glycosyltransferase involved in cell wall biosynthesis
MDKLTFSVIVPVYNPDKVHLQECLDSVFNQSLPGDLWELIIVHDLDGHQTSDLIEMRVFDRSNVKFFDSPKHLGISLATNKGSSLAAGEYLVFLDQDDLLDEHALQVLKVFIDEAKSRPELLHSDYRLISESGSTIRVVATPDYSPVRLLALMYPVHLKIVSNKLWQSLGGYDADLDGSQDHDFYLRASSLAKIIHVPEVMYSWRASEKSSQSNPIAKPLSPVKTRMSVETHLESQKYNYKLKLVNPHPALYQVDVLSNRNQSISIVIPTAFAMIKGKISLGILLDSIEKTALNRKIEIVCVIDPKFESTINKLDTKLKINWVRCHQEEFNYSKAVNAGVNFSTSEHILILNDDMEFISDDWVDTLNGFLEYPNTGIIGAKLLFPDGKIQHAGVGITDSGHCYHILYETKGVIGTLGEGLINHEVDAVTGAFIGITRKNWDLFGGLSEIFPGNYNDIALCLMSWNLGKSVIQLNSIELIHHESLSRTPARTERELADFDEFIREYPKTGTYTLTPENLHQEKISLHANLVNFDSTNIQVPGYRYRLIKSIKHRGIVGAIKNYFAR